MRKGETIAAAVPTVWECDRAVEAFTDAVKRYMSFRNMSRDCILRCALAAVWMAGRAYQTAADRAETYADAVRLYNSMRKEGAGCAVRNI